MQKRRTILTALTLFVCFAATVECRAFQDTLPAKPKPLYLRPTPKIISILPPKGITLPNEESQKEPLVGVVTPALSGKPETIKVLKLSASIAFIGTVFFLMLHVGRRSNTPAVARASGRRYANALNNNERVPEEVENQRLKESIGTIINGEAANIARYFNRNREEFHLAMKFHQHKNVENMVQKVDQMKRPSAADSIAVAKQMGFGKGEVELALHLKKIQQSILHPRSA